jgi:hypothetical protein
VNVSAASVVAVIGEDRGADWDWEAVCVVVEEPSASDDSDASGRGLEEELAAEVVVEVAVESAAAGGRSASDALLFVCCWSFLSQ